MSHDLRNPLHTITMLAEHLAAGRSLDPQQLAEAGGMLVTSARRMTRMIQDVLDFAKAQLGGQIPLVLTDGDLGELCAQAFDELRIAHPRRELRLERNGDLRGSWDRDRMIQATSNLISNALQHGLNPIVVRVTEAADRHGIDVSVNNRGPVIVADRLSQLFHPLRLESLTMKGGFGSRSVHRARDRAGHGGRCEVESDATHGTTFRMYLPRTKSGVART